MTARKHNEISLVCGEVQCVFKTSEKDFGELLDLSMKTITQLIGMYDPASPDSSGIPGEDPKPLVKDRAAQDCAVLQYHG